ncbi:hypothetical protein HYPSUDRAFT_43032 [Hypholoma sublateritium FD-334 SS-4]|uniref:Uncharacterized protein n=1 Tax=Hypholoma sublateritium (strain FD-334 SS-4) TaxID=945553 RepID=A0A0D2NP08_HYPSF|nr:hypothetical protein HYPSUDRAFT_43032 [Hypholoma sublateritium FD-334 SS-4]
MTDSAPAANAKPRLLTIVLLPTKHNITNDEGNGRHLYEEVTMLVPSRQGDINNGDNRQYECVVLPAPKKKHGGKEDNGRYVLLPSNNSEDGKRYATILFPDSYEAAVDAALSALRHHMPPGTASRWNVEMLFPVTNNEGKQVWSAFDATTWPYVMEEAAGKVLGIRQKVAIVDREEPFVSGVVGFFRNFLGGSEEETSNR